MGLETRAGRFYYYEKRREGQRVVSRYVGAGLLAALAAETAADARQEREQTAGNNERYAMKKNKLTANSTRKATPSPPSPANACDSPVSTSTKASGEKNDTATCADNNGQTATTVSAVAEFFLKLADQKNPSAEDVAQLRRQIVSTPAAWNLAGNLMSSIRHTLIEKISTGAMRAIMLAEADILAKRLDYDTAPPIERLLIDHILNVRLRLIQTENSYNNIVVGNSISLTQGTYWDNLLSSTQARFLRAIESLARIRRLARNTPALQINIAHDGGKQVNVQSDVNASSEKAD